jgi:hypothetical protein
LTAYSLFSSRWLEGLAMFTRHGGVESGCTPARFAAELIDAGDRIFASANGLRFIRSGSSGGCDHSLYIEMVFIV